MNEKRFVTGGYKIYDTYKEEEYLVNNVDAQRIVDTMNNLDTKARERSKALSKLEKENEQLRKSNERIIKDIDLALGFIRHKGYSLQDINDYEDWKNELER